MAQNLLCCTFGVCPNLWAKPAHGVSNLRPRSRALSSASTASMWVGCVGVPKRMSTAVFEFLLLKACLCCTAVGCAHALKLWCSGLACACLHALGQAAIVGGGCMHLSPAAYRSLLVGLCWTATALYSSFSCSSFLPLPGPIIHPMAHASVPVI